MRARKPNKVTTARRLANDVLRKVEAEGAYATLAINNTFRRNRRNLSSEDRALVSELVYGTLRWRRYVDYALAAHSHRPLEKIEPMLLRILRMTAYQLLFTNRIPIWAAVDQGTELARVIRGRRSANFVNGVLRGLAGNKDQIEWPDPSEDPRRALSINQSFPDWMTEWWIDHLGYEKTESLMIASNKPPPLWARVNTTKTSTERLCSLLSASGIEVQTNKEVPDAVLLKKVGDVTSLGAFESGLFHIQDAAAQAVCHLLDPKPGHRVLDACSAPGGKTATIAQLMNNDGGIISADSHPARLSLVRKTIDLLGLSCIQDVTIDLTGPIPSDWGSFDRVLVDAPCSAIGVIRRHPESKWRLVKKDIQRLVQTQKQILDSVSQAVKPGGYLVYSICSFSQEEGPGLINAWLEEHPEFERSDPRESKKALWHQLVNKHGELETWPDESNIDAFYAVRLMRKE
jgi:16S rRNA (cytosine967-C5)-methyltransferase